MVDLDSPTYSTTCLSRRILLAGWVSLNDDISIDLAVVRGYSHINGENCKKRRDRTALDSSRLA